MSWLVFAVAAAVTLALHQISFRFTANHFTPAWATMLYMAIIVVLMAPFVWREYQSGIAPAWSWLAVASILALAVTGALFVVLYQISFKMSPTPSLVLVVTDAGAVILAVSLAMFIFNEAVTPLKLTGIAMAVGGIILALKG